MGCTFKIRINYKENEAQKRQTSASFLMYFPSMLVLAFISCSWSFRWAIISFLCCNKSKQWAHISVCQAAREEQELSFLHIHIICCCQHQPEFQFLFLFSPLWVVSEDFSQVYGFLLPCIKWRHSDVIFLCMLSVNLIISIKWM